MAACSRQLRDLHSSSLVPLRHPRPGYGDTDAQQQARGEGWSGLSLPFQNRKRAGGGWLQQVDEASFFFCSPVCWLW